MWKGRTVLWGFLVQEHETAGYAAQICQGRQHGRYHCPSAGGSGVIGSPREEERACREETHDGDTHHNIGWRNMRAAEVAIKAHDDRKSEGHGRKAWDEN